MEAAQQKKERFYDVGHYPSPSVIEFSFTGEDEKRGQKTYIENPAGFMVMHSRDDDRQA
jgi:hypothetical protein